MKKFIFLFFAFLFLSFAFKKYILKYVEDLKLKRSALRVYNLCQEQLR